MEQMIREQAYRQVVGVLPPRLRQEAFSLPLQDQCRAEELRLRVGQPMSAVFPEGERPLGGEPVRAGELEQLVEIASRASVHAVLDQLRRGYLTVEGGIGSACVAPLFCGREKFTACGSFPRRPSVWRDR